MNKRYFPNNKKEYYLMSFPPQTFLVFTDKWPSSMKSTSSVAKGPHPFQLWCTVIALGCKNSLGFGFEIWSVFDHPLVHLNILAPISLKLAGEGLK